MLSDWVNLQWWQWWILIAITINTTVNLIVFFRGRKLLKKQQGIQPMLEKLLKRNKHGSD